MKYKIQVLKRNYTWAVWKVYENFPGLSEKISPDFGSLDSGRLQAQKWVDNYLKGGN